MSTWRGSKLCTTVSDYNLQCVRACVRVRACVCARARCGEAGLPSTITRQAGVVASARARARVRACVCVCACAVCRGWASQALLDPIPRLRASWDAGNGVSSGPGAGSGTGLGPSRSASQPAPPTAFLDFFLVERAFLAFSITA